MGKTEPPGFELILIVIGDHDRRSVATKQLEVFDVLTNLICASGTTQQPSRRDVSKVNYLASVDRVSPQLLAPYRGIDRIGAPNHSAG
jgi:hypothetical protein